MRILPDYLHVDEYFSDFNFENSPIIVSDDVNKVKEFNSEDVTVNFNGHKEIESFFIKDKDYNKFYRYMYYTDFFKNKYRNKEQNRVTPVMKIKIDGKEYEVLMLVEIERFLYTYSLNDFVESSFAKVNNWEQFDKDMIERIESYNELKSYQSFLVSNGGEGYNSVFIHDLSKMKESIIMDFMWQKTEVDKALIEPYFFQNRSKEKDLSIIDGVKCFKWNVTEDNNILNNYFYHVTFAHCSPKLQKLLGDFNDGLYKDLKRKHDEWNNKIE